MWLVLVVSISVGMGRMISRGYHLNWVASATWFFAGGLMVAAWNIYSDASLKYFDGRSSTFKPRYSKAVRSRFLARAAAITAALVGVGLLDQVYF